MQNILNQEKEKEKDLDIGGKQAFSQDLTKS